MAIKKYKGIPYHLWNPFTPMDKYLSFFGYGPTIMTRGDGPYVYNGHGKRYINGNSATWNFALGYGQEELIEAACKQMRELPFANCWGSAHPRAMELAAKLVQITSGNFAHVYLGSNGSEAVEAAFKLARQYYRQSPDPAERGRYKIISLRGSYHGYTLAEGAATGYEKYAAKYGPLIPGFLAIDPPYCYRCPYQQAAYPECGLACAQALGKTIESEGPETVAAFIFEPVLGEMGVITPPEEYYAQVGEICRRYGMLMIVDEVTTGMGRCGKLFVSQDWAIQPDILCLGKVLSGGYLPLSATLTTETIFQRFRGADGLLMHGSTNSGHPVAAAVGLAAIDLILRQNLPENAARVGAALKAGLEGLMQQHPLIGEVRGRGLMLAVELVKDRQTRQPLSKDEEFYYILDIVNRGLLISLGALVLFPQLNLDQATADEILHILDQSLHSSTLSSVDRMLRLVKEFAISRLS